jgi:FlaA1/EpsC-like NDP-sugar epimerase
MKNRNYKIMVFDFFSSGVSLILAFLLRFDFDIPVDFFELIKIWLPLFSLIQLITFQFSNLYARLYRYTSLFDLVAILKTVSISSGFCVISTIFIMGPAGYPRSTLILYFLFNLIFTSMIRLFVRVYYSHFNVSNNYKSYTLKNIIIVGAGKTGDKICRELMTSFREKYNVVGFCDDNPEMKGAMIHGKKVICKVLEMQNLSIVYDEIVIAAPSATGEQMRQIVLSCKGTGKPYKTVPSLNELINKPISFANIRNVHYADLLGREEIKLDTNSINKFIEGKRVLVTGAGGSIGSELVKQCLKYKPAEIICIDQSEENIFNLEQDLKYKNHNSLIRIVLASINNFEEIKKVFLENQPKIVIHAAAYKHVPLQEKHPWTAVKTNIGGTLNLTMLSKTYKVEKFILVSTDKAVNPTNIMGASKRIAEKLIQSIDMTSKTKFMAVRFGNVLGSSGSAIPIFTKQIKNGGPITITHPEMTRYFMSIPEASQLILQCGAIGQKGEIFLLDMGKPIKILQMAKDLVRLSGFEPDKDISIIFTGLRPGEKLYEELQLIDERKVYTSHEKIMILKSKNKILDWQIIKKKIINLINVSDELNDQKIRELIKEILPTYNPSSLNTQNIQLNSRNSDIFKAEA